jgi:hypothetical protein
MAEKPLETEGIVKGGKREPVAEDDQFPPEGVESGPPDTEAQGVEAEENPQRTRPS